MGRHQAPRPPTARKAARPADLLNAARYRRRVWFDRHPVTKCRANGLPHQKEGLLVLPRMALDISWSGIMHRFCASENPYRAEQVKAVPGRGFAFFRSFSAIVMKTDFYFPPSALPMRNLNRANQPGHSRHTASEPHPRPLVRRKSNSIDAVGVGAGCAFPQAGGRILRVSQVLRSPQETGWTLKNSARYVPRFLGADHSCYDEAIRRPFNGKMRGLRKCL